MGQLVPVSSSLSQVQERVVCISRNGKPWSHWHLLKSQGDANLLNYHMGDPFLIFGKIVSPFRILYLLV